MKVLILGGTGAMGKPLVEMLSVGNSRGLEIIVTSRSEHQSRGNITYVAGNARDKEFLLKLLQSKPDVVVDFMNYDLDEFATRMPQLLRSTDHYIWFSSCRVYANSDKPLTESSPRLLEVSDDKDFLATNRYALRKARQEDLIRQSGFTNYTVIRPYITYNDERLQLGVLEKEQWLNRLLKGKPLVISKTMLDKTTTLTHGNDVAKALTKLIGNQKAKGEVLQLAGQHTIRWIDLLKNIYIPILRQYVDVPHIYCSDSIKAIEMLYEGGYNTIYDRNYNRSFDSSKADELIGKVEYTPIHKGICGCLTNFMNGERKFLNIDPIYEAYQDILTNSHSNEKDFNHKDDYLIYKNYSAKSISEIEGIDNIIEFII